MNFKKITLPLSVCLVFLGLSFSLSAQSSLKDSTLSSEKRKTREAVLAKIKKRQSTLTAIKERRSEKQIQRQIIDEQTRQFEQEKEALQFALYKAKELAEAGRSQDFLKKSKPTARGIILKFKEWPPAKKAAILNQLKSTDLKEDAKLKRLKKWIYKWPQSREVSEAKKLCKNLSSFKSVKYCEPDVSVGPVQTGNSRDEFYKEQLEKVKQRIKESEKIVEESQKDMEEAQKEYDKIQGYVEQDQQAVKVAEQDVESDKQSVERAKKLLERAKTKKPGSDRG